MSDLISRQDAVTEIHKYFVAEIDKTPTVIDEDGDELYADMTTVNSLLACNKELSKRIKALPSADRPTKHTLPDGTEIRIDEESYEIGYTEGQMADRPTGEWVECESNHIEKIYLCSNCKNYEAWGETEKTPYCPNCGAKMNKGGDDE